MVKFHTKKNLTYLIGRCSPSNWVERGGCVLVQVELLQDWVECRGVSIMPCLRVTVNHSASGRASLLHHHEDALILAPQVLHRSSHPGFSLGRVCCSSVQEEYN